MTRARATIALVLASCSVPEHEFTPDAPLIAADAAIDAYVAPSMLSLSPGGDIALGDVIVGATSGNASFTVSNDGDQPSGPIVIAFDDTTLGFAIGDDTCSGQPLPPRRTCGFTTSFTANAAGGAATSLHVRAAPGGDVARAITANALTPGVVRVTTSSYAFGGAPIDGAAPTHDFTIQNQGQATIGAPVPTTTGDASFTVQSTTCSAPLAYDDTCIVSVAFHPMTVGQKPGSLKVTSSAGAGAAAGGQDVAMLSGTGTAHVALAKSGAGTGLVSSQVGLDCGSACSADVSQSPITLSAQPDAGAVFLGWSGDCSGATTDCSLVVDGAKSVTAGFDVAYENLVVVQTGNGAGSIATTTSPSSATTRACAGAGCTAYAYGTIVTLAAQPTTGTTFAGWSGDCAGSAGCSVTMTAARSVSAMFSLDKVALSVAVTGGGSGAVTSSDNKIACPASQCAATYDYGTTITLVAAAQTGSTFASWTGCTTSSGATCTVSLAGATSVTASFTLGTFAVNATTTTGGTVTSADGKISCGATCSHAYAYSTQVSLAAVAQTGSHFTGWTGGPCDGTTTTPCAFAVPAAATSLKANFALDSETLTVAVSGTSTGTGSVASLPSGISCGATCTATFPYNTTVVLTATPTNGSTASWSGCASTNGNACTVAMTAATTVTATFSSGPQLLKVTMGGNASGTVTSDVGGVSCTSGTCTASIAYGTRVTLTATPTSPASFAGWTGACASSTTSTCTLMMTQEQDVGTTFSAGAQTLTYATAGNGAGTLSATGCTASPCSLAYNSTVTLTASASASSTFAGWTGDCSSTGASCQLTMNQAHSVGATFAIAKKQLTILATGNGTVATMPAGTAVSCPTTTGASFSLCQTYDYNTPVVMTAMPAAHWSVASWSTCNGTPATCQVAMTSDTTESVTFVQDYTLGVAWGGDGSGSVSGAGIACASGSMCTADYPSSPVQSVTLAATPAAGSIFSGWLGACTNASGTCTVTMSQAQNVTATFAKLYAVNVSTSGLGTVSAAGAYASSSCGPSCTQYTYASGATIALTASPGTSAYFGGWSGDCGGTGATCQLTATKSYAAIASFGALNGLSIASAIGGTVSSTDGTIKCGSSGTACSATFRDMQLVTLNAIADAGAQFVKWTGACVNATTTQCMLAMTSAQSAGAVFYYDLGLRASGAGSIATTTSGSIACTPPAGYSACQAFAPGTIVTVAETPQANNSFVGWSDACSGNGACIVTMNAAANVTASFVGNVTLTAAASGDGVGTITGSPGGISCSTGSTAGCSASYPSSPTPTVTLTTSAATGSMFVGWSGGGCSGLAASCTVMLPQSTSVTAQFAKLYNLTAAASGPGTIAATVSGGYADGSCAGTGCTQYTSGAMVTLVATPSPSSYFTGWTGACATATSTTCTLAMNANATTTATFASDAQLTVVVAGSGAVTSSDMQINCPSASCTQVYPGTTVTLTAAAGSGATFASWSGCDSTSGATCTVAMTAAKSVTATFAYNLNLAATTGGSIATTGGIACTPAAGYSSCMAFAPGVTATVSESPGANYYFAGWSGACNGGGSCSITMNGQKNVVASFALQSYPVTVSFIGSGMGSVSINGTPCGSTCTQSFVYGTPVTITAMPTTGGTSVYLFDGWSGPCSGTGTCTFTVGGMTTVGAQFDLAYKLTVVCANGYVTGPGINCLNSSPSGVSTYLAAGRNVTLDCNTNGTYSAISAGGCNFDGSTDTCTLTLNGNTTATIRYSNL